MPRPAGTPESRDDSTGAADPAPGSVRSSGGDESAGSDMGSETGSDVGDSDMDGSAAAPRVPRSESQMRRAIDDHEFTPHFQSIVSLASGDLLAAEVLVRWDPEAADTVPPSDFIGLAEETGLMRPLGRQMLERAARLLGEWGEAAPPRVHVNVSPSEFGDEAPITADLIRTAREHGIHMGRFCVEISERQARVAPEQVRRLRELGAHVALDDFGCGYASYALLGELPITDLKLDGSLVRALTRGQRPRAVVSRIVQLGRDLGFRVIAEYVQTAEQLERLRETGCRVGQGFLLGEPRPPEAFGNDLGAPATRTREIAS